MVNFTNKAKSPWAYFYGKISYYFFNPFVICLSILFLFYFFLFLVWVSFDRLCFPGYFSISSKLCKLLATNCSLYPIPTFKMSSRTELMFSFIPDFSFSVLSLSWGVELKVVNFLVFSKNQLLVLLNFKILLLCGIYICFNYYYFLTSHSGPICIFLSGLLRWKVW